MTSPHLPAELRAALDGKLHGLSRTDAAQRSATITRTYRGGGNSGGIRSEADALAYALARMPATYAAVAASLAALEIAHPTFAPVSLLDCGAGPGTATWAAAAAFPSLTDCIMVDANPALRDLALALMQDSSDLDATPYLLGDAALTIANMARADLVILSYVINELDDGKRARLIDLAWDRTLDTLLIVEPGTPAGWQRILDARAQLIAQGAEVIAPCPHNHACPLATPDWCHFSQRLQRSRAHKQVKGAELPYEDEKYIYVALSRSAKSTGQARVLTQPDVNKVAVTAKLCTMDGLTQAIAPKRDKPAYTKFRKLDWGDSIDNA